MEKRCNGCGKFKDVSEFYVRKSSKDGYRNKCKICVNLDCKNYYKLNVSSILNKKKIYIENNKEIIADTRKRYYKANVKEIAKYLKTYRKDNKQELCKRAKSDRNTVALYNTYYYQLTVDEAPMLSKDNKSLKVKCRYCGVYFKPLVKDVSERIKAINGKINGENALYCSEGCKTACPIYRQHKYPKGFKKATSREVNPLVRQLCFERDNWTCQTCGATQSEAPLHCHHIEGYAQNPRLGNDVANTITLCKECHKEVHRLPGCNYYELRCKKDLL